MLALQLLLAMAAQAVERGQGVKVVGSPRQMLLHMALPLIGATLGILALGGQAMAT